MSITVIAGGISTALAIYSAVPYIRSVLNGKTKPDRLGWLVFTIMNGMVFFAQVFSGGRSSTLVSLAFFVFSLTVFLLTFIKGTTSSTQTTKLLFAFALITMIIWALTRNNDIAIWLTVLIDLFATAIIILKTRRHPGTENVESWAIGTLAYVFSCITLYHVPLGILYVRPIYGLVLDAALVVSIYYYNSKSGIEFKGQKGARK
jgi:hypothetical protein